MFRQIGTAEIIIIVLVLLLLFGSRRLPDLARSIRQSATELRKGFGDDIPSDDDRGEKPREGTETGGRSADA